jgi:4-amino-4-deoxy-L-arabinose transferase-like glycosyltransferase
MRSGIKKFLSSSYSILLLFVFLILLRVIHLTADPPANLDWSGGVFFDEGMLAHGARNKVLFGQWDLDEWNDFYISPILTYIKWLVFSIAGVGIAQVRLIPLFFSGLSLLFFYLTFKESFNRKTASLALFLLGFNYLFIMFNRPGLTETSVVSFMILSAFFWQRGWNKGRWGHQEIYFFLSGVSCFTAYIFKNLPYLLPVPLLATLLSFPILPQPPVSETPHSRTLRSPYLRILASLLLGMLIPFLIWYVFFYLRYFPSIHQAMSYYKQQSVPRSFDQILFNIAHLPFVSYFMKTPIELFLSLACIGYLIYLLFHVAPKPATDNELWAADNGRLHPLDLFMLCWYLMHFFFFAVVTYRPVRYYLPIVPPMCALAARAMITLGELKSLRIPKRLSLVSVPFLIFWLTVFLSYGIIPLLYRFAQIFSIKLPDLTWKRGLAISVLISLIFIGMLALISRKWGGQSWSPPHGIFFVGFLVLPLGVTIFINGYQYYRWAAHPQYTVRDISRELGQRLQNAFIAGLGAPTICLENKHRAIHVYERFFNYRDTLDRYPITHLFMGAYNQEVKFYYRQFFPQMQKAVLEKVYPIKDSHFYLYSLVEPSIEKITVSEERTEEREKGGLEEGGPSSPPFSPAHSLKVTLFVRNNEHTNLREVKVGWLLHPPDSEDITALGSSPISLGPGEMGEVTLSKEVTPGSYHLLAFTLPSYQNIFEAEYLDHRIGKEQKDPEAYNGVAWKVSRTDGDGNYAVFGPYLRYPPGYLKATFRLKTSDNTRNLPIARIDVASEMGRKVLATRDLRGEDFRVPGSYEEFGLSCYLEDLEKLEFRVLSQGQTDIWIDQIRVEFTKGLWYGQPVLINKEEG